MSMNSLLKEMVLERLEEYLPFFKFKFDSNACCYSKFPDFQNLCTLLTMNKGSSVFKTNSSSQASQDDSTVFDIVKPEKGRE